MKIRREVIQIASGVRDARDGTKGEPEQQPIRQVIELAGGAPVTSADASGGPAVVRGTLPVTMTQEMSADELVRLMNTQCRACKNFDRHGWLDLMRKADHPMAPKFARDAMNQVRAGLLMNGNVAIIDKATDQDGDFNPDHVMANHMGLCRALGALRNDYVVVHMVGRCPDGHEHLFEARRAANAEASATRDDILNKAQGR